MLGSFDYRLHGNTGQASFVLIEKISVAREERRWSVASSSSILVLLAGGYIFCSFTTVLIVLRFCVGDAQILDTQSGNKKPFSANVLCALSKLDFEIPALSHSSFRLALQTGA